MRGEDSPRDLINPITNSSDSLISVTVENADRVRGELIRIIFGTPKLPSKLPDTVYAIEDEDYDDLEMLKSISKFEITLNHGIKSIGYVFYPNQSGDKLVIYHQGHKGDFIEGKKTIAFFLERGATVIAFSMPLLGMNNQPIIHSSVLGDIKLTHHNRLKFLKRPLQYFITPVIVMINYMAPYEFHDISMIGLSGGGWTTTIAAAVDDRIRYSFPVAGSYPMYLRFKLPGDNFGDFEQTYDELYSKINYLDIYVLGSIGEERCQIQVLNKYDPCCFYGNFYENYEDEVKQQVRRFDQGSFDVYSDSSHSEHKISETTLKHIHQKLSEVSEVW